MIIWLIGISGAGKTTLGNKLKEYFDTLHKNSFIIDGDWVRDFYDNDLGFSREDRKANIKRIMLAAHVLSRNGIIAIVCNISPFEELRKFARNKIHEYNEIYLRKNLQTCVETDVKNMYRENAGKTEIVGLDLKFDEPTNCDLIIDTDKETEQKSLEKIIEFIKHKYPEGL